jgi:hypothetical protein
MQNKSLQFVFLLVLFTIILDFAFGKLYSTLYFTEKSKKIDRLIHSAIGTNEEILIFGSSRAYHHYNPEIFEKKLGMSCFNVGQGGQNIYYHLALLKSAIKRKKTKVAILDIISIDFEKTDGFHDKEKLGVLLPFVHHSDIFHETVLMRSESEKLKLLSSIYLFNSKQLDILRNIISLKRSDRKGYVGLDRVWDLPIASKKANAINFDNEKMKALLEFIELCKLNEIELYIFISPFYMISEKSDYALLQKFLLKGKDIKIFNYESDINFLEKPKYFADPAHLNKIGAGIYSHEIANLIVNDLKLKSFSAVLSENN